MKFPKQSKPVNRQQSPNQKKMSGIVPSGCGGCPPGSCCEGFSSGFGTNVTCIGQCVSCF